eukprot:TRINITY_DN32506_c0_g3_i1.p1 TRINITY_DN32506_c0_g3~~TRINITY_DN32506_c0_g3_i1.p1  ORF type:complete len:546 (+),score=115.42 TRINITY_DN32506_c0_g3_i1:88-1725(+)
MAPQTAQTIGSHIFKRERWRPSVDATPDREKIRRWEEDNPFSKLHKFGKEVVEEPVHIEPEEVARPTSPTSPTGNLKAIFRRFDQDGNGVICKYELRGILRLLSEDGGRPFKEEELDRCMAEADTNHDGLIDYGEFIDWLMTPCSHLHVPDDSNGQELRIFDLEEVLRPLFDIYDLDRDGVLSLGEFEDCHMIIQNSLALHPEVGNGADVEPFVALPARKAFQEMDANADSQVSFEEFVSWQYNMLSYSGLTHENLRLLIGAIVSQLRRIFSMVAAHNRGRLGDAQQPMLRRSIFNVATFAKDIWSQRKSIQKEEMPDLSAPRHYSNRWSEPPLGIHRDSLCRKHISRLQLPMRKMVKCDTHVLIIPDFWEDGCDPTTRTWLGAVKMTIVYEGGTESSSPEAHYCFQGRTLGWLLDGSAKMRFEEAYAALSPELRLYCLLQTEANFGSKMTWQTVQDALRAGMARRMLTSVQLEAFNAYMEGEVCKQMKEEGLDMDAFESEEARQRSHNDFLHDLRISPRMIMSTLSKLGFYKVTAAWEDFMKSA